MLFSYIVILYNFSGFRRIVNRFFRIRQCSIEFPNRFPCLPPIFPSYIYIFNDYIWGEKSCPALIPLFLIQLSM